MTTLIRYALTIAALTLGAGCDNAPPPAPSVTLAPNAPTDKPVFANGPDEADQLRAAVAPYIEKARQTYPEAKKRYLAGLPAGHVFFVTAKLRDGSGSEEQVFVTVAGIRDGVISGQIASDVLLVRGHKRGEAYSLPESELIDWLVSRPDGTEEGNVVGKFLDEWPGNKGRR